MPRAASAEAQAIIAHPNPAAAMPLPDPQDLDAWRALVQAVSAQTDDATVTALACATTGAVRSDGRATSEERVDGDARWFVATPEGYAGGDRAFFVVHGGSFVHGGGPVARKAAELLASYLGMPVWSCDYRMPPDHHFPAGLDDVVTAYSRLLDEYAPSSIVAGGTSAGGNIVAALIHRAHEAGLTLPAALVLHTPVVDLEMLGDTWQTLTGLDPSLATAIRMSQLYAGEANFRNPHASPLHGPVDYFPPTLLISGTRDPVLSDTVRMHRKLLAAGVEADLVLTEGEPHGGYFGSAPEDFARMEIVKDFVEGNLGVEHSARP
ncbi:MAG: alpha/beta hydrolase [Thermomicrobiales bacterium]